MELEGVFECSLRIWYDAASYLSCMFKDGLNNASGISTLQSFWVALATAVLIASSSVTFTTLEMTFGLGDQPGRGQLLVGIGVEL